MRYEIKFGKFGAYFYDNELERDVDLNEVLSKLNEYDFLHTFYDKMSKI